MFEDIEDEYREHFIEMYSDIKEEYAIIYSHPFDCLSCGKKNVGQGTCLKMTTRLKCKCGYEHIVDFVPFFKALKHDFHAEPINHVIVKRALKNLGDFL